MQSIFLSRLCWYYIHIHYNNLEKKKKQVYGLALLTV